MKLYAYKQYMEIHNNSGFWINWSEKPPEECGWQGAIFLGYVELVAPKPTIDSIGSPNG